MTWDKAILTLNNGSQVTISYDVVNYLPIISGYKNALGTAETLALAGYATNESNQT